MRQRQFTFNFTDGGEHRREERAVVFRNASAARIRKMTSAPQIQQLIASGQIVPASRMENMSVATFVRDNRPALKRFVELIANGGHAKNTLHQERAWALLQKFDEMDDYALALELKELGLCDSTESFGRELSSFRYLLFEFRRVMKTHEKRGEGIIPQSPPSPARSDDSSPPHIPEEAAG